MDTMMMYLTAIMVCLTALLVIITGIYAYLTRRMAKASETSVALMREQLDSIARPYVCLSLYKPKNNPFIYLRIENIGKTTAHKMTLIFGPEFKQLSHVKELSMLNTSSLFTKPLASFPPNSPILYLFGSGDSQHDNDGNAVQQPISIIATYSFAQQTVCETTWLDVSQYHASMLDKDPVVDALDRINKAIVHTK